MYTPTRALYLSPADPAVAADRSTAATPSTAHSGRGVRTTSPDTVPMATPSRRTAVAAEHLPVVETAPAARCAGGVSSQVSTFLTCGGGDVYQRITPAITCAALGGRLHGEVIR